MNFAAGFGAGMGAGIGTGIAIGTSSGRQAAFDEFGCHIAENGLTICDRDGKTVTADMLMSSLRASCDTSEPARTRKAAMVAALLVGLLVAGAGVYFAIQR